VVEKGFQDEPFWQPSGVADVRLHVKGAERNDSLDSLLGLNLKTRASISGQYPW
jgi:hypothetical protein